MTDWVLAFMDSKTNKHPATKPHKVASVGGDLFMPGCRGDCADILKALRDGRLSREQLLVNVSRLYRMARALRPEE